MAHDVYFGDFGQRQVGAQEFGRQLSRRHVRRGQEAADATGRAYFVDEGYQVLKHCRPPRSSVAGLRQERLFLGACWFR